MSGRARLTVFSALASLMAAASLLPLATPRGWFFRAAFLVVLQTAAGAGARRVPLPRPLTVLVQALVSLVALTVMFTSDQALGGILPGPESLRQFGRLVQDGIDDVNSFAIPAPVTPGIKFLLVGGVLVIALAVDAVAVTYNSAAPAGLPLLALYAVAAGLEDGGSQWLYFLIASAGYLLLLLAEGRDRLSRWGRVFGGAPRQGGGWGGPAGAAGGGAPTAPVRTGRRIGVMALGIALVLPAVLPSLGAGLLDTDGNGGGGGSGTGHGGVGKVTSVRPEVALQDYLNQPDNREVLRYKTNSADTSGMYLRIVSLDKFDGTQWSASSDDKEDVPEILPTPQGLAGDVPYTEVSTDVTVDTDYAQGWLPMPYPALRVQADGDWSYEPEGRMVIGDGGQTTAGMRYTVSSMQLAPTAAQLAAAPPASGDIAEKYEEVPGSLPAIVADTARQVTSGATTDYARAVALQRYFTSGEFVYNTRAKSGTGVDAIARFLETKEGFCEHFAFTMAAMARTLHIPARVAVGFTPGSLTTSGWMSVGFKDAHAWPELYFQGVGWVRFEPTPYRGTAPSYTVSTDPATGGNTDDPTQHGNTGAARPTPTAPQNCANQRSADDGSCGAATTTGGGTTGGGGTHMVRYALVGLLVLLALLLPTLPLLWRRRVRSARLGGGKTLAAWEEVLDTGWDYGIAPDESETPRRAMARLVREAELSGSAARSAHSLATAVERALYAPDPAPSAALASDVHAVRAGLHAASSTRTRLRARFLPRSFARVTWRASARRAALSAALAGRVDRLTTPLRRFTRNAS